MAKKLQVKLFIAQPADLDLDRVVPVFHAWIRDRKLHELLIDVVDYKHVPNGPGIALIGHASDYFLDLGEGRPGLLYSRKRDAPDDVLADSFKRALDAALLLEAEGIHFRTDEFLLRINDRLAPDDFASVKDALEMFLPKMLDSFEIEPHGTPKQLLAARVLAPGAADVATLRGRLAA